MEYLRKIDFAAIAATSPEKRYSQKLLDHDSGARTCNVGCVKTPTEGGSPAGMHTHTVDHVFYVLRGTMQIEIAGTHYEGQEGTLIVVPAGVPHRYWNSHPEPLIHLAFNAPLPDPNVPFSTPVSA